MISSLRTIVQNVNSFFNPFYNYNEICLLKIVALWKVNSLKLLWKDYLSWINMAS